ncbi:6-phosphofructokinase [Ruminococcaceae bacterium CPB6]|jgi:6-phosphofructokinase 1|uniref:ATP-dependent 6-phosphofructokinase n=1 Tax=Caproicibacterium lactatifermentans TaxID=2666138 RepID=A0A859DP45_9FIRM|nr:ATP-dependent 6-phosphofructokinase [Caproicibacterium lactatifermentans]ARP50680.1 6-phosphofructokinase [Ruminococcaceae bacterium CPB6]QKN23588.1 ATP-dependent 6-phosphofructokinase [Caproicibacterium lactatifermentans]
MLKVGVLTSGGDCQGLNAAIRGLGKALLCTFGSDITIYGIEDGYRGLIEGNYHRMVPHDFSGIINLGGTILGTSRQPFKQMRSMAGGTDKVKNMKDNYNKMGLDCLVVLGGNGTHKTANLLSQKGLSVITLPKTIDNDIWGTDITFGFQSAVDVAANVLDCIHTTATSHGRIFIVEVMGHKVGWLTLHAGLAGSADAILLPEIPYKVDNIVKMINHRSKEGKRFSILAVAEGALSQEEAQMSKKELKAKRAAEPYPSVSYRLAHDLEQATGHEIRVTVPGHIQRGGNPCPYDRVLSTRFGVAAAQLIKQKKYGYMVAMRNNVIVPVPLCEVAGKLKTVPPDCNVIQTARDIGISFGD